MFCWRLPADGHNTFPKSTRRNIKLNKFASETAWLPYLLCKHSFTSSVWNFCRWVTDYIHVHPSGLVQQMVLQGAFFYKKSSKTSERSCTCTQTNHLILRQFLRWGVKRPDQRSLWNLQKVRIWMTCTKTSLLRVGKSLMVELDTKTPLRWRSTSLKQICIDL